MFQKGDLVVLKSTGEIGICTDSDNEGDFIHAYFQEQKFQSVLKRQVTKQSALENQKKLKQYQHELKEAKSQDKHQDLIDYLAGKVKAYYLLALKDKDEMKK